MAYDGAYPQQGRPYNGPSAPRAPPQRQYPPGQGGPQYDAPRQYGERQEGYDHGYDDYGNGGYDQGYGPRGQHDDYRQDAQNQNYPQQDYYGPGPDGHGRGGGRPMPGGRGGRGGPPQRQMTGDPGRGQYPPRGGPPGGPGRGGYPNGPQGRSGRSGPPDRLASSDPLMNNGRGGMNGGQRSPQDGGYGGGPFPNFPGQQRKPERDEEQIMADRMNGMDISGRRPAQGPQRAPPRPGGDAFGPRGPPQRGLTQPNYANQRRGPGPDQGYGPSMDYRDEGYGPPGRTMTMPAMDHPMRNQGPPPHRAQGGPYNAPGGRGVPPRPSTAQGTRGPSPRMPPSGGAYQAGYDGGPRDAAWDQSAPRPSSYDDFYHYYDESGGAEFPPRDSAHPELPDFDSMPPPQQHRNSLDQHPEPGAPEQTQRGANRFPELNRTKSQPDLRQPQQAVFEMAGDIPPLPLVGHQYQQPGFQADHYGGPGGYGQQGLGPGLPNGPSPVRQGSGASSKATSNPDSLPSHPTPVRPGLMPNSVASQMVNKPPPVRNYAPPQTTMSSSSSFSAPRANAPLPSPALNPPVTPELLERLRNTIKADPNDQASATILAKKLVEAMDVLVPALPDPRARAKARDRYSMDAHKILKKLSNALNLEAMFFMADCLGRGVFGQEPDNKDAFTLYQSAAKLGHAAAAYRTAVCCEIGNEEGGGTRKDPLKAIQWYKRAATLGDTPAMYKVGMILLKGLLGQPKNPREAVGWLKRAAERADAENPHALHELGLLYESAQPNDAMLRDEAYAFELFRQAADLGYKFSQFRMGCAYEYGLMGCPIDPRLSIMWYSKSATQEEHQSELALSGWYLTGSDAVLGQSDTEAYLWARKAAMAGLAKAEYAMGYFTEVGIGVPANMEDAKRWYWRAAAQDFPKARERLEDLKRSGKNGPRQRERISRSKMVGKQNEGECAVM